MTYDLTNLKKALSYTNSFEHGCIDCIYYGDRNFQGGRKCRYPNSAEVHGVVRELKLLGLELAEVDEAVCKSLGRRDKTFLAEGSIGCCITPERFCEVVEDLLRTKEG